VDGGSHRRTQVGRARRNIAKVLIMLESELPLDDCVSSAEPFKNFMQAGALLHRDDSELVLLVHPNEESLCLIVEDTTTVGPVSVKAASLKEAIALLEQEVVLDQLTTL